MRKTFDPIQWLPISLIQSPFTTFSVAAGAHSMFTAHIYSIYFVDMLFTPELEHGGRGTIESEYQLWNHPLHPRIERLCKTILYRTFRTDKMSTPSLYFCEIQSLCLHLHTRPCRSLPQVFLMQHLPHKP